MKIEIGNYKDRLTSTIHTRYMNKKYGPDWADYHTTATADSWNERWLEGIENALQASYNVINTLWADKNAQRINVRIDKHDTWSMDHTLAHIIAPMLIQLKDTKHSAPVVESKDVPKGLRATKKQIALYDSTGEPDAKFFDRWDYVLDEMIWTFEQKCRDDWMSDYYEVRKAGPEELKDALTDQLYKSVVVWNDEEGMEAHQARMANGFRLFGKYYESLWS